jgi:hypothetical protein
VPAYSITSSARASGDGGTFEAERLGGFAVDDQLMFGRRLHWQVGGANDFYSVTRTAAAPPNICHRYQTEKNALLFKTANELCKYRASA